MVTRKQPGGDTSINSWWGYGDKPTPTPVSCMKGFCRKPVSQWGPNQKSQGHSADDTKLVTENERPSMYVYHTMPMVRTLSLCWQVLYKTQWNVKIPKKNWIFHFYEKSWSLWQEVVQQKFYKSLANYDSGNVMTGNILYELLKLPVCHSSQVPSYNFEWTIIGAIPHKFN